MSTIDEKSYVLGQRQAWVSMLKECLIQLGYDDPERQKAAWIPEREAAIAALRKICKEHGDNEWEDNLFLADIIENHLADHLF